MRPYDFWRSRARKPSHLCPCQFSARLHIERCTDQIDIFQAGSSHASQERFRKALTAVETSRLHLSGTRPRSQLSIEICSSEPPRISIFSQRAREHKVKN